jgi:hypothetical protein
MDYLKKITAFTLIVLSLTTALPARAFPVIEVGPNLFNSTRDMLGQFVLDKIPLKIAKKLLDGMTDSVVNWAAGGFKKEGPSFISNFDEYAESQAIGIGTAIVDDIVLSAENYAVSNLAATEIEDLKECTANKKIYDKNYNLVKSGLLQSGIDIGFGQFSLELDGAERFNEVLTNWGKPAYHLGAGKYNDKALKEFIEDVVMTEKIAWEATGLAANTPHEKMLEVLDMNSECDKTLFLRRAGLTYSRELIKFVGETYREGRKGSANSFGVPNFDNVGESYKKTLSDNWVAFQTDASRGGFAAFEETAKLENTPWGAKYKAQAEISDQLTAELGKATAQLQRNAGFLDRGDCVEWKKLDKAGGTDQICVDYQSDTPGSSIREAVNKRVLQQYDQLNNVEKWSDLLLTTGVKLVSGVLSDGILPLASNTIDKGLSCLAGGGCDDSAFGETRVASSQTITNSGNGLALDDVVDIKSILYGQSVLERDQLGNIIYERIDQDGNIIREKRDKFRRLISYVARSSVDDAAQNIKQGDVVYSVKPVTIVKDGNEVVDKYIASRTNGSRYDDFGINGESKTLEPEITVDYARPQYQYQFEVDANGNATDTIAFETHSITNALVLDKNGRAIPLLVRENGSLILAEQLQTLLSAQGNFVRNQGVRMLMQLDVALPGPDLGWEDRLQEKGGEKADPEPTTRRQLREILARVKTMFQNGLGTMVNDPFDVVLVRDGVPYTNPEYTFSGFQYPRTGPGTLTVNSDGSIKPNPAVNATNYQVYLDNTFPKTLTLAKPGATTSHVYTVVSMNTHAGYWFNPATKQVEAVGNIPYADDVRNLIFSVQSLYTSALETSVRRGNELRSVQVKLKELQRRYESLPFISPSSTLEDRVDRDTKENEIAYELSLIREKLPIFDDVAEARSRIKDLLYTYDQMAEMVDGTSQYRSEAGYATRFGDLQQYRGTDLEENVYPGIQYYTNDSSQLERYKLLFLKDKMGVLYCGLQDHSLINEPVSSGIDIDKLYNQILGGGVPVGDRAYDGTETARPFLKMTFLSREWKWLRTQLGVTYSYRVPWRCYETSVIGTGDAVNLFHQECPTKLDTDDQGDTQGFARASLVVSCSSVYKSTLSDYLDAIDPTN